MDFNHENENVSVCGACDGSQDYFRVSVNKCARQEMAILEILISGYPSSQRMTSVFGEHDVFLTKSAHCPEEPSMASDFVTDEDIGGLHILYPACRTLLQ